MVNLGLFCLENVYFRKVVQVYEVSTGLGRMRRQRETHLVLIVAFCFDSENNGSGILFATSSLQ